MTDTIIIKIESGAVSAVYTSEARRVIIVDHDLIEGGESFEQRMRKAVFTIVPDSVRPEDAEALAAALALECRRPADRKGRTGKPNDKQCAA